MRKKYYEILQLKQMFTLYKEKIKPQLKFEKEDGREAP